MAGRARRIAHLARDAVVLVLSAAIISTSWGKWTEEPALYVLVGIGGVFVILSAVDVVLVLARVKNRGYFFANAIIQLVLGFLLSGLFLPFGLPVVVVNLLALVTLRQKKTPEELQAHPPLPKTRNYKVAVAVGTLVMVGSLFLPWVSAEAGTTASMLGLYTGMLGRSTLPNLAVSPVGVIFALITLALTPVAVVLGALGLRWRKSSGLAGVLGILAGVGIIVALPAVVAAGTYVFLAGAAAALVGFVGFRRA